jgi:serine/threonine-protein kinase
LRQQEQTKSEEKKHSFTSWLRLKLLGKDKEVSPVDTQFLADLSDITTVGRYQVIRKLGQGSMGVVYLGRDPYINRNVSIKISRPNSNVPGEKLEKFRERFFLEAQSAGSLLHPNIVAVYDAGLYKDFCYITMEYVDGLPLARFCREGHLLSISKAVEIIFTVCKGLDFAHKQGLIHRDVKPSNIMISRSGRIKITDFGIAQVKSEQSSSKGLIGSPGYMSPEQVKEQPVSDTSDIFSLGCVLYEVLTGEKAFPGENCFSVMYKITHDEPTPVRVIRPELPEILWKIIQKALAKEAKQRYQSCMDFAFDLRVALRGVKGGAKTDKIENVVDYIQSVPFFEDFSKAQVKGILNSSNVFKISSGKVIVAEGEIDDSFFILLSGKASVRKGAKRIAMIQRGECFGEMSYLSGQSRAATVVAETDCIFLKISAMLLDRAASSIQLLFLKKFALTLIRRLSKI